MLKVLSYIWQHAEHAFFSEPKPVTSWRHPGELLWRPQKAVLHLERHPVGTAEKGPSANPLVLGRANLSHLEPRGLAGLGGGFGWPKLGGPAVSERGRAGKESVNVAVCMADLYHFHA